MDFEEEIREELERKDREEDSYVPKTDESTEDDEDISAVEKGFMEGYENDLDLEKQKESDEND